jgi:hypothetical protein
LLIENWNPVTKDLGLIEASVEQVASDLVEWHARLGVHYTRKNLHSLSDGLKSLEPLSSERRRVLLLPTRSKWTVFLQSGIDGSDPFPAMSFLVAKTGTTAMRVCVTSPTAKWPAVIWEVYASPNLGGEPPLNCRRAISAANDGGRWTFHSSGEPFAFEDQAAYDLPQKKKRFTKQILQRYLSSFGLSPFEDDFYVVSKDHPALLLQKSSRWENPPTEFTLEQVVAGLPWSGSNAT